MIKKFVSWNVNGIRAAINKDFYKSIGELSPDILCLQETKVQEGQVKIELEGFYQYWNYAEQKGYSGTAIFTKDEPLSVKYGIGVPSLDTEGRVITLEFENYYLLTVYVPNSRNELIRLPFRLQWENAFLSYIKELDKIKPVIYCGDLNVAHEEIDLKNPDTNHHNPGFSDEERQQLSRVLASGFIDSFRYFYPDLPGAYTWWSYRFKARLKDIGWRIDYFIVSQKLKSLMKSAQIHKEILGSDHCPVSLEIDI